MKTIEWNDEEIKFLLENYKINGVNFCSEKLLRTKRAICQMAHRHKLYTRRNIPAKEGYKFCTRCKEEKLLNEFNNIKGNSCRICYQKYFRQYRKNNPFRAWATRTIETHKRRNNCNISFTTDELTNIAEKTLKCPLCENQLSWGNSKIEKNSPTLDRLDNDLNLNLKNITIMCHNCNSSKRDRTLEEYREFILKIFPNLEKMIQGKSM